MWQVLPFGVKCAPYYFNKILRPVVEFFRVQNIRNSLFVDDFLIMMRKMFTTDHSEFVLQTLQELGWEINWEKSKLIPLNYCEFIGFNIFSKGNDSPWIQVTQKKLHKLKRHISVALKCEWINARFLAKIAGECIAMMRAIVPAKLLLRNIYRTLATKISWSSQVFIDEHCRNDLNWWFSSLKNWNGASLYNNNNNLFCSTVI